MPKDNESRRAEFAATALPHVDKLYSTAVYLARDADDAADLLQETLLRAYRAWEQFRPGTNCKAWLLTILYNAFRNLYRSQRSTPPTVAFDDDIGLRDREPSVSTPSADPADLVASQVLDGEIATALRELPPEYLEVVMLVDVQELTYEEAATAVGCPVGTIRSRLSRGRQRLHASLHSYAKNRGLIDSG